ncbi:MAG: polyketide synthase, partial [bacterium]|nr:polyketide synthase [bacterium]
MSYNEDDLTGLEIAVIGMAVRFPGAAGTAEFQKNLRNGTETISFFTDEELHHSGVAKELYENPNYVKAKGHLEDAESFDSGFFGYTPAEAAVMDPQIRIVHECTWTALEEAGYNPETYDGLIGLYAGAAPNMYWQLLTTLSGENHGLDAFSISQLTNKDGLTTRVSYNLNLKGPSYLLQTACSTPLVAVHLAGQALLSGECA